MVYALKLLILVMIVAMAASVVARPAFGDLLVGKPYKRAWRLVFMAAVVSFLSLFPPVFLLGVAIVAFAAWKMLGGDLRARLAAFMLLLVVFPPVSLSLEGVAGINRLLGLDHMRVLVLVLLLPAAVQLIFRNRGRETNPFRLVDIAFFGYQFLQISLNATHSSFTGIIRLAVETALNAMLPYYVMTRGLKSLSDIRYVAVHFMIGCVFVAAIAALELTIQRNVYTPLQYIYGVQWQGTHTLMRGSLIRVQSTTQQPILLAFMLTFGLGVWTWLSGWRWRRPSTLSVYGLLLVALFATFSRGPWLGAMMFFMSLLILRLCPPRVYALVLIAFVAAAIGIKSAGADDAVMDVLKSVFGSSKEDIGSIEYRKLLLDTALALIKQSPTWGVPDYLSYMQNLKQGEGIIDLVNTYLIVTLNTGLVGLSIYVLPQIIVISSMIWHLGTVTAAKLPKDFLRAFVSLLVAQSVVLLTTSSFGVLPYLMLFMLAAPMAYMRLDLAARHESVDEPVASDLPLPAKRSDFAPNL